MEQTVTTLPQNNSLELIRQRTSYRIVKIHEGLCYCSKKLYIFSYKTLYTIQTINALNYELTPRDTSKVTKKRNLVFRIDQIQGHLICLSTQLFERKAG